MQSHLIEGWLIVGSWIEEEETIKVSEQLH